MARSTDNIFGGFDGRFYVGAKGATMPINPKVDPDTDDFSELGYISDDGVSFARGRDINEVMAMGVTNAPVWQRVTSQESTVTAQLMETTAKVLAVFYGQSTADMTTTAASGSGGSAVPQFLTMIEQASTQPTEYSLVIDLPIMGTDFLYRRCYSRVMVTETGDLTYTSNDPVLYPVTFKAMIGADGTVCKHMWAKVAKPTDTFPPV